MNTFDANTWTGPWPFTFQDAHTARTLGAHLRAHGIQRALVSPLAAVFAPAPGPANRALLKETRGLASLVPVPVLNPALANWQEELAAVAADPRVRAVRLLPNYHHYRLRSRRLDEVVAAITAHGLRLVVTMRLIDERHEYFALKLKSVPAADLAALLDRHPKLAVLASGLQRPDILALLPKHPRLLADLSFAEWDDTVGYLLTSVSARQLAFASHTPFLITAAASAKLNASNAAAAKLSQIAAGNLERWLGR